MMMAQPFHPGFAQQPMMHPGQVYPGQMHAGQQVYPGQPPAPARWPGQAAQNLPTQPRQAPQMQAQAAAPRPPAAPRAETVRGVPPPDSAIAMPAPEALNITGGRTARDTVAREAVDWAGVRAQLARIGATGFQLEALPQGGCRFSCQVTDAANRPQQIEGRGADEAEAIQRCLAQVSR